MKLTYKLALLAALGLATASASYGQDLILGFNDAASGIASAENDYVVDLGLTGASLVADANANSGSYTIANAFSSTTFNTAFSADVNDLNNVAAGIIGASASGSYPRSLYLSAFTTPATAGSGTLFNDAANATPDLNEYASSSTTGWTAEVATAPGTTTAGTVSAYVVNPLGTLSSGVLSFNLYEATETKSGLTTLTPGAFTDEGTLTINANNDTVTFAVAAVPEPATYGLLAAGGLLIVAVRRQLMGKTV
jgi:PEP-CTERM motif